MFSAYVSIALIAASSVSGLVVPRAKATPATWWIAGLEEYRVYNERYNALGCAEQHNTKFFDACCHPLKKTQTLASRPAMCNPASASASASAMPTSTVLSTPTPILAVDVGDDCDDDEPTPSSTASSALPTSTDDGDDDGCDGDDGDDEPAPSTTASSALPTATDDGDDGDGDDCDDDEPSPSTTFSSVVPTSTDSGDDDDCEPCEEGDDDCVEVPISTTLKASSTPAPTATPTSSVPKTTSSFASSTSVSSSFSKVTPTPTATPTPTPKPTSTLKPTSTTSTSTKAATSVFTGDITKQTTGTVSGGHGTFFYQGGVKGACEVLHTDNDLVAAIDYRRYGFAGKVSPLCGQKVRVTNTDNGKSVDVVIADSCPTCDSEKDLDLSYKAFLAIAKEETGYIPITYTFIGKGEL